MYHSLTISEIFVVMIVAAILVPPVWRRWKNMRASDRDGTIGPARIFQTSSRLNYWDFIGRIGIDRPALVIAGQKQLRASVGVWLLMAAYIALVVFVLSRLNIYNVFALEGLRLWAGVAMIATVVIWLFYRALDILVRDARYDHDILTVRPMFGQRREFQWKALQRIRDDGEYWLLLFYEPGGKAKVLKHSTGIADFKTFALAQIQKNRASHA